MCATVLQQWQADSNWNSKTVCVTQHKLSHCPCWSLFLWCHSVLRYSTVYYCVLQCSTVCHCVWETYGIGSWTITPGCSCELGEACQALSLFVPDAFIIITPLSFPYHLSQNYSKYLLCSKGSGEKGVEQDDRFIQVPDKYSVNLKFLDFWIFVKGNVFFTTVQCIFNEKPESQGLETRCSFFLFFPLM